MLSSHVALVPLWPGHPRLTLPHTEDPGRVTSVGCPGHCSLPAPHLMQEHPTVTTATCPDTAQCSLVDRTLTSDTCPDPHPSSWQDRSWALATPVWSACNVGVAGARQHLSPTPRRHIARAVGPRPAPAHLAASAVQGGWVPAAAGRGGAAARWEVADGTGCEVTCTRLREAGGARQCTRQGLPAPPAPPAARRLPALKAETRHSAWAPARPDTAARQF